MPRLTIRFEDALHDRLIERANSLHATPSAYVRDVLALDLGVDPGGYHARFDELHATAIQIFSIIVASVGHRTPDILEQGMADARDLLRDRGLLDPEADR